MGCVKFVFGAGLQTGRLRDCCLCSSAANSHHCCDWLGKLNHGSCMEPSYMHPAVHPWPSGGF